MSSVNQYRIYCTTEQSWVYSWGTDEPTVCANNTNHTVNLNSVQVFDSVSNSDVVIKNNTINSFQEQLVSYKNIEIDLKSFMGISLLRNKITSIGSATATSVIGTDSEIKLSTTVNGSDSIELRSIERGQYLSGLMCEVGIAIRLPNALVGNQTLKYGYFDANNGFYFKITSTDFQCCILHQNVETCISRNDFSNYKLDGTESNLVNLDFSNGHIFKIQFSWYGFGVVKFGVYTIDSDNIQKLMYFHQYQTLQKTSTQNPNLPINVTLENNGTESTAMAYVAGRQFSIFGNPSLNKRFNSCSIFDFTSLVDLGSVFSIRKKDDYKSCKVVLTSLYIVSTVDTSFRLINNTTLTGSAFSENIDSTESCVEVDADASALTGGDIVYSDILFANTPKTITFDHVIQLHENYPITLTVKNKTLSGSLSISLQYLEYW